MPRTPAEQTHYLSERPIYEAHARLERCISTARALRSYAKGCLPVAAAELHMNDIETHLDAIVAKLAGALGVMTLETDRLQAAEERRYANDNVVTLVIA